ncbi:uncharacterized protein [Lepeophtheirus salmonis]|uniref:Pre-rRNA-processing protein Ipi1 N-terminal domain-containing protein n=1 Tax=Lepeophtheirus salmonis TaxID=72036 RepID=A0A0K2UTY9_LEPSM|nr:testis-expressed protein 10-like [Lepeophtheirus salmonis]
MVKKAGTKRKKAERAKTQLKNSQKTPLSKNKKQSFKLPKGLNELDTRVNAKSLVLPSQLQNEDTSGPSTSRNLPLKHYLIKLKHYSRSTRLDGLKGIKEILSNYPESIIENLSVLMYKVCPLLSDTEENVGKETSRLLLTIVTSVDSESLRPFYSILSAHLCCALSHIDQDVQMIGLRGLDEYIQAIPEFIQISYKQLLPGLLNQISVGKEGIRRLSNKVDCGKVTLLQWRTEVLERLHSLFQLILKEVELKSGNNTFRSFNSKTIAFNDNDPFICQHIDLMLMDESIPIDWLDDDGLNVVKKSSESFSFLEFFQTLMPLLFETWKEASLFSGKRKLNKSNEDHSTLHPSNGPVFTVVVDIIQVMISILRVEMDADVFMKFQKGCEKSVCAFLLKGYPYRFASTSMKNKIVDRSSISINLKFSCIYIDVVNVPMIEVISNILDYSLSICDTRERETDDIYNRLLKSLCNLIFQKNLFPACVEKLDNLLQKSLSSRPRDGQLILLMSSLSSLDSCRDSSITIKNWINNLPLLLVEASKNRDSIISVIHKLQKQGNSLLLKAFSSQMNIVLEMLKASQTTNKINETLQVLIIICYRLQTKYPALIDLMEKADDFTKSLHTNLDPSISVR